MLASFTGTGACFGQRSAEACRLMPLSKASGPHSKKNSFTPATLKPGMRPDWPSLNTSRSTITVSVYIAPCSIRPLRVLNWLSRVITTLACFRGLFELNLKCLRFWTNSIFDLDGCDEADLKRVTAVITSLLIIAPISQQQLGIFTKTSAEFCG